MLRCDYVFNKWMLDTITRDDGTTMRLYRGGYKVTFDYILRIDEPMDIKVVKESNGDWVLMCTPLWMTIQI